MRYFLLDRVTEIVPGERARGVKCVTLSDPVLHDHFPDIPVLPGALLLEGAAQLSGFFLECTFHGKREAFPRGPGGGAEGRPRSPSEGGEAPAGPGPVGNWDASAPAGEVPLRALLVQVRDAKFHGLVSPGDRVEFEVRLDSRLEAAAEVSVEGSADGRRILRATLTFVMKRIDSPRLQEHMRYLYRLWTRDLSPPPAIP